MTYNCPSTMPVVLAVTWSLQLLQCVPAVGTPTVAAVYSTQENRPSVELQTPDNRVPADQSDTDPVHLSTVEGSADVASMDFYPVLTTGSPMPVAQPEYAVGSPYYLYVGRRDNHRETDNPQPPEYLKSHRSNANSTWNRYERVLSSALPHASNSSPIGVRTR
jgi:hypothetical protein